ncbi:MAG: SDR family oxidoreductase [Alicyclobacillaceae bacterium]|nr:SDR family oxidoreductase [Alicyclobacillaceae bacterium]
MSVLDKFRLDGKVSLVTGGASGIGYACALALAEAGSDVAVVDINGDSAKHAAEKIAESTGRKVIALQADVTSESDTERMVMDTVRELGRLDVCFANAGIAENGGHVTEYDKSEWDKVIAVNLTGVFLTDRAAARVMQKQGSGSIINTASIYGLVGDFGMGAIGYTAAKGGVVQITRTLAVQLAPSKVRVNAIAPAFIRTNLGGGQLREDVTDPELLQVHSEITRRTPLGRWGQPEDLEGIVLFLASEASSFCTGYTYAVDGGWLAV